MQSTAVAVSQSSRGPDGFRRLSVRHDTKARGPFSYPFDKSSGIFGAIETKSDRARLSSDLWVLARARLQREEQSRLPDSDGNSWGLIDGILGDVRNRQSRVNDRLFKIKTPHGERPLRHYLDKLVECLSKFKDVGDTLVQIDPAHAAVPWAGIRILLSIAQNDSELFRDMAEGVEQVSVLITRYAVIEALYLPEASSVHDQIRDSVIGVYTAILQYLAAAKSYYEKRTFRRALESAYKTSKREVEAPLARIMVQNAKFEDLSKIVDAELRHRNDVRSGEIQETVESTYEETLSLQKLSKQILNDLGQIDELSSSLVELKLLFQDRVSREVYKEIAQWLSELNHAGHHAKMQEGILPDSGRWLIESELFSTWKSSLECPVFWLHGRIGCGKTKLMSAVIEHHRKDDGDASPVVAYFYCDRSEEKRTDPVEIFRSLVKQLAVTGSELRIRSPIPELYQERRSIAEEGGNFAPTKLSLDDCADVILDLLEGQSAVLLIDALDECQDLPSLLGALSKITQKGAVKCFLSGRDELSREIECASFSIISSSVTDNSADIKRYITLEVESIIKEKRLLHGKVSNALRDEIVQVLNKGADGMFLWVKLQLQNLINKRMKLEKDVREKLRTLPPEIGQIYEDIFIRLEESGPNSHFTSHAMLKWLLCAQRPLSRSTMLDVLSMDEDGKRQPIEEEDALEICCNLVIADNETDTFRFAHLSVQEFLEGRPAFERAGLHEFASRRCVQELIREGRARAGKSFSMVDPKSFYAYSIAWWEYHFDKAGQARRSSELDDLVTTFLLNSDDFAHFTREALRSSEREQASINNTWPSMEFISSPAAPTFALCAFGMDSSIEEWATQMGIEGNEVNWNQFNCSANTPLNVAIKRGEIHIAKNLLEKEDIQPDKKGPNGGETSLMVAARERQLETLKLLLDRDDVNINAKSSKGVPIIHLAIESGSLECLNVFLNKGARIEARDDDGATPFIKAGENANKPIIQRLLKAGADVFALNKSGMTILHKAVADEAISADIVQLLFRSKVDIDAQTKDGQTALHVAAGKGSERTVKALLQQGAKLNIKDHKGNTSLDLAAELNRKEIIQLLLSSGATCEPNGLGQTELHQAIEGRCDAEVVKLFLDKGVDVKARTNKGDTALDLAVRRRKDANLIDLVKTLLAAGADLNKGNTENQSTMHHIAHGGSKEVMELLVKGDIDLGLRDHEGKTPLAEACASASTDIASLLLDRQDIDDTVLGTNGETILHSAVEGQSTDIIEKLLDRQNNNITATDQDGDSALDRGVISGRLDIVRILLKRGAGGLAMSHKAPRTLILALVYVKSMDRLPLIKTLLDAGFNVNTIDPSSGRRPLHYILDNQAENESIARLFLDRGAELEAKDYNGDTALNALVNKFNPNDDVLRMLLSRGADVSTRSNDGSTPLHYATIGKFPLYVQLLLEHGADISICDNKGSTALHDAARFGSATYDLLIERGIDIDRQDNEGHTALSLACYENNLDLVVTLIENGANPLIPSKDYQTPLLRACRNENEEIGLHVLRSRGSGQLMSNVDKTPYKTTPLILAATKGHLRLVEALLSRSDVNIDQEDHWGDTALIEAAAYGRESVVKRLIETNKVSLNHRNKTGATPLMVACQHGHLGVVKSLVASPEVNINAKNKIGVTPLTRACATGETDVVDFLLHLPAIDINASGPIYGRPALFWAATKGEKDIVQKLLRLPNIRVQEPSSMGMDTFFQVCRHGWTDIFEDLLQRPEAEQFINRDCQTRGPHTALATAARRGHTEIVRKLLQRDDVDLNSRSRFGMSALSFAAGHDHLEIAEMLLEKGAETDFSNQLGNSPLGIAAIWGNVRVVKLLLERGVRTNLDLVLERTLANRQYAAADLLREAGATDLPGLESLFENADETKAPDSQ